MPDAPASSGPSAADLAVLVAEYEEADLARMRAERRYAHASDILGRALAAIGPRVLGLYLYRGYRSVLAGGTPVGVVFRELAARPPGCDCAADDAPATAGHACTDHVAIEDPD